MPEKYESKSEKDGFHTGQRVRLLVETGGTSPDDREITLPAGAIGEIDMIHWFGGTQGWAVHIRIGDLDSDEDDPDVITNIFDDGDGPLSSFIEAIP